jgi:hypothetical protein
MWKLFQNIFSTVNGSDVVNRIDDWKLTKEETVRYQLEWLRALPSGFQLAQRFIGVAFSIVFLIMVLTSFVMLAFGYDIVALKSFISETMANPIMIIFSLFFGGGLINSWKGKMHVAAQEPIKTVIRKVKVEGSDEVKEVEIVVSHEVEMTKKEARVQKRLDRIRDKQL